MAPFERPTRHSSAVLRGSRSGPHPPSGASGKHADADRGDSVSTDTSPPSQGRPRWSTPRRSLFVKYFVTLFIAVVVPLLLGAAGEAWFGYRGQRAALN